MSEDEKLWGIWCEAPGRYTGWLGFAAGRVFTPLRFTEAEARQRAARSPKFTAKIVPPTEYELPWTEETWEKSKR